MTARTMTASAYRATQSEADFQRTVTGRVDALGGLWMHLTDSRGQAADGFPDLVICLPPRRYGDLPRVIFAELKSMRGRLRPKQIAWLDALTECGTYETYTWRPDQWGEIDRVLQ